MTSKIFFCTSFALQLLDNPMDPNKNLFPENPLEYNIFHNDRPQGWRKRHVQQHSDIITHMTNHHNSMMLPNPQKQLSPLSYHKSIPLNSEVLRERSQMIVHPSKISKDVPVWFKGDTYKYYMRNQYNNLYKKSELYTIDYPTKTLVNRHLEERSQPSTPRSRQSNDSDSFYNGAGTKQVHIRRSHKKKTQRQLSPKIGSLAIRNFELPKIQLKIGHDQFINGHNGR